MSFCYIARINSNRGGSVGGSEPHFAQGDRSASEYRWQSCSLLLICSSVVACPIATVSLALGWYNRACPSETICCGLKRISPKLLSSNTNKVEWRKTTSQQVWHKQFKWNHSHATAAAFTNPDTLSRRNGFSAAMLNLLGCHPIGVAIPLFSK